MERSKTFCLASICLRKVAAASSFILSPWVVSCFLRLSISSLAVFSSACFGSSFLVRVSRSRRPSLQEKIAPSMLMVPTLVPVAGGMADADADDGALGTAALSAGAVCAIAVSDRANVAATRILINLLVIDPLDSFGLVPGTLGSSNTSQPDRSDLRGERAPRRRCPALHAEPQAW